MAPSRVIGILACLMLSACAGQSLDPRTVGQPKVVDLPWGVHCETDRSYNPDVRAVTGIYRGSWVWGEDSNGEQLSLLGDLEDGFFNLRAVLDGQGNSLPVDRATLRQLCLDTILRDEPRDLARVMAARDSRDLDIALVFPGEAPAQQAVSRVVIFGDSLSDSGRLKHRLEIFPGKPYWLGRFSNGPAWPEYLEASTTLAIQNNAYGGASVERPVQFQEAGLLSTIKEGGRFFVSGSLAQQVEGYLQHTLSNQEVRKPDETAFIIWAGANDYISKEPINGLITTFLNTPEDDHGYEKAVDDTIISIAAEVELLFQAGARRFVIINIPDLGTTPIPLQNDTYVSGMGINSDEGRRIELSRRLTALTDYHNRNLAKAMTSLAGQLPEAQILMVDSQGLIDSIYKSHLFNQSQIRFDYGFALDSLQRQLQYDDHVLTLPKNCYTGMYLGSFKDSDVCPESANALFWDVVHPTTYAHCWQSYQVGTVLADAGWIPAMPAPEQYRYWCNSYAERDRGP